MKPVYRRPDRGNANKHASQHRAISSTQLALAIIKSLVAPIQGSLLSASFAFSCVLPCASVAAAREAEVFYECHRTCDQNIIGFLTGFGSRHITEMKHARFDWHHIRINAACYIPGTRTSVCDRRDSAMPTASRLFSMFFCLSRAICWSTVFFTGASNEQANSTHFPPTNVFRSPRFSSTERNSSPVNLLWLKAKQPSTSGSPRMK